MNKPSHPRTEGSASRGKMPSSRAVKLAFAFLFFLLLLETLTRVLIYPSLTHFRYLRKDNYTWFQLRENADTQASAFPLYTILNPLSRRMFPVKTNSLGVRAGREFEIPKPDGVYRIVWLGDSITFGWGLEEKYCLSSLLENCLEARSGKQVEAINGGVPNYSSRQGLVLLNRKMMRLQPDLVIVQFGWNDASMGNARFMGPILSIRDSDLIRREAGEFQPIHRWSRFPFTELVFHIKIVTLVVSLRNLYQGSLEWATLADREPRPKNPARMNVIRRVDLKEFEDNLEEFSLVCARNQMGMLLIDPVLTPLPYRKIIRKVAARHHTPVFSQFNLFMEYASQPSKITKEDRFRKLVQRQESIRGKAFLQKNPSYYLTLDSLHPTEIGNLLLVEQIVPTLLVGNQEPVSCPIY